MKKSDRLVATVTILLPFLGAIAAVVMAWNRMLDWADVAITLVLYVISAMGVTVGFHRLMTHRAFRGPPWLEHTFARMGQLSLQGGVIDWVADHRKHHLHSDKEGDPHSPHHGAKGVLSGFWHAHAGWLAVNYGQADWNKFASDLVADPVLLKMQRRFPLYVVATFAIPAAAGFVLHGFTPMGALRGAIWGGLFRVFWVHHVTWCVNSVSHMVGKQPFASRDHSRNVAWLAIPSLGETWHNNHHAFPRSARHGILPGQVDISAWVITALEKMRLVTDVVTVSADQMARARAKPQQPAVPAE